MIEVVRHFRKIRIAAIVLAVFVLVPAVADAVLPGRNGRIAFTSGREAGDPLARIYLRTVSGSSGGGVLSPAITPLGGQSRHASWSPDRTKIVFANGTPGTPTTENYDLFVKDMVSGSITALDGNEIGDGLSSDHPAWSPDGTRIAYEHQPTAASADRNIMIKTVGTAMPAVSLTTSSQLEFKPAWSPDSQTVYYAKTVVHPNPDYDIMRKPAAGGTEVGVLTASGADEYQPSISPDGTQICFTYQAPAANTTSADIYITSLPTPGFLTKMSPDTTKGDINCTFSPDGTKIAYVNGVFSQGRLVMKPISDPTGQPVQLEDDPGSDNFDGNPDWAPDGSPDCPDSTVSTPVDTPITIELECTDTGPAYEQTDPNGFVANDGGPANGTTSDDAPLDNPSTVKYTPNAGFTGTDKIVFTSFDDFGFGTDQGTVTINVGETPPGGGPNTPGDGIIRGTPGDDNIKGTPGDDVINCGNGDDVVRAGDGDDVINCGGGNDRINAGGGNDQVRGGSGNDRIQGKNGNDVLAGNSGRDRASGGRGRDKIKGNAGPDRLLGGPGNDLLRGGPGRDILRGGPGRDVKHP